MNPIMQEHLQTVWKDFGAPCVAALATAHGSDISVRSVSIVRLNERLYFQTSTNMEKAFHVASNPHVSVCRNNITIKGLCKEVGHPLSGGNEAFATAFAAAFSSAYRKYSSLPSERVFEIEPELIKVWNYSDGAPNLAIFDIKNDNFLILPQEYEG